MSSNNDRRIRDLSPEKRAILEQQLLKRAAVGRETPIVRRGPNDPMVASFCQRRLWFLDQLTPGTATYNVPNALRIRGDLNVEALERAINAIIRRHEVLRATFDGTSGEPVPVIRESWPSPFEMLDLSAIADGPDRDAELLRMLTERSAQSFDLANDLMLRAFLVRLADRDWVLLLVSHHIAWDLASKVLIHRELAAHYDAYAVGVDVSLPEPAIQYPDFALWQKQKLEGKAFEALATYWKTQLTGAPAKLEVPADLPRPRIQSGAGAKYFFTLPGELIQRANALSRQAGCTLYMTFLATFKAFLYAYTGVEDVCVGSPIAGRNRVEIESMIGFFINTLVLRTKFSAEESFLDLLKRVREMTLGAYAHQEMPFEKLVEVMKPERDLSRMALFQVNFRLASATPPPLHLAGLDVTSMELIDNATAKFDLALELSTVPESSSYFEYSTDLYKESSIVRMREDYERVLAALLTEPDVPLNQLAPIVEISNRRRAMEQTKPTVAAPAKPKGLRDVRRKTVDVAGGGLVNAEPLNPGSEFTLVVRPAVDGVVLADWVRENRDRVNEDLLKYGAVLFRGFRLPAVADFENVALALSNELFGEYGDLPREGATGRIYASTPYPPDQPILFHNESSHLQRWPMKISFHCVKAAETGGETPILDCRDVCSHLDPAVLDKFRRLGVMYVRNFVKGVDVDWQDFFHTNDHAAVEATCAAEGVECEWVGEDDLRVRQRCRAVAKHPKTGEELFFNQVQLHHISCLDPATRQSLLALFREEDLPRNVFYGDGTPIEDATMDHIADVYWKQCVKFPWQEGDMIVLDNMRTAHARLPYTGPRKIVVAMAEMLDSKQLAD